MAGAGDCVAGTASVVGAREVASLGYGSEPRVLRYVAAPGERNRVRVVFGREFVVVRDSAGVAPGGGCRQFEPPRAGAVRCALRETDTGDCSLPGCKSVVYAFLGDLGDSVVLGDRGLPGGVLFGGPGDDELRGGSGHNVFVGGQGDDLEVGFGDLDLFDQGKRANGSDTLIPSGIDPTVSYEHRRRGVWVDLEGDRDDGQRGERDRVLPRVGEVTLRGGHGSDRLVGGRDRDELVGGPGRDSLAGGPGNDGLYVDSQEPARPHFRGGTSADRADGGPGADYVIGNRGPNRLSGGSGYDTLFAGPGADHITGRDRSPDVVHCGPGGDTAALDGQDYFFARPVDRCEGVRRVHPATAALAGGTGEGDTYATERGGNANIACPPDAPSRCRGQVRFVYRGVVLGAGAFNTRHGFEHSVDIRITPRGRRLIRRETHLEAVALVISRDRFGVVRTTRTSRIPVDDSTADEIFEDDT